MKSGLVCRVWFAVSVAFVFCLLILPPAHAHHAMGFDRPATALQGILSGLAHPVLGFDHLVFILALAMAGVVTRMRLLLPVLFIGTGLLGAVFHMRDGALWQSETLVATSVVLAGLVLVLQNRRISALVWAGLALAAGGLHGYAFAESIIGAEPTPLYAYFCGLIIIQSLLAFGFGAVFLRFLSLPGEPVPGDSVPGRPARISIQRWTGAAVFALGLWFSWGSALG